MAYGARYLLKRGHVDSVKGIAAETGVPPHIVRYYARIGLLKPQRDPANNYQRFTERDRRRLLFIRQAQALGYSLREIRRIFRHADHGRSPCPEVRDILRRRIDENHRSLSAMLQLQRRMERALRAWAKRPDGIPDGDTVCILIESAATGALPHRTT